MDSEGVLYDEEGNVVGYVEDGYVYDTEGNRVGTLDTDISDQWQLELYEQEMAGSEDNVLGYTTWGANYDEGDEGTEPFHVSTFMRDEDEDD